MGWWGKAVGGTLGFLVGGPWGAAVGATLGHGLDRGAASADLFGPARAAERARLQAIFIETTFKVMGHIAKSDGRVDASEIAFAESIMSRMGLTDAGRRAAIQFFTQGKSSSFALTPAVEAFRRASAGQIQLHQLFLEIQLAAVYVRGVPASAERAVLEAIRRGLQFPGTRFRHVERVIQLQYQILSGAGRGSSSRRGGRSGANHRPAASSLNEAYAALGVAPAAADAEVKRAYRLLMSQHHPDKLMSRGAPAEAIKMASQKTHEIRQAYEMITRARGTA